MTRPAPAERRLRIGCPRVGCGLGAVRASARPVTRRHTVAAMDESRDQDQQPRPEDGVDPAEDREPQEEEHERAETVDGALSPGTTATDSPTSRGE